MYGAAENAWLIATVVVPVLVVALAAMSRSGSAG